MIKLELSEAELQILGAALKQMPYHMVVGVIEKIGAQVANQSQPQTQPEEG